MKRFIVFQGNEKSNLVNILMRTHFSDFEKLDSKIKNIPNFYENKNGYKITMDYRNDILLYHGEIAVKDLWLFKCDYENKTARELKIVDNSKSL